MAGLMVYIPGGGGRQDFQRLGLESLLDKGMTALPFEIHRGPDGGGGSLIGFDSAEFPRDTPTVYDEKTQEWLPAATDGELACGRYWIGYVKGKKPRPEELQRRSLFDGEPVELGDHAVWVIPVADYLPRRMSRDRVTGKDISLPVEEHEEFVRLANETFQHFLSEGFAVMLAQNRVVIPNARRLADMALAKNYRVNADVIDLLGIFQDLLLVEIAKAATGLTLAGRVLDQKKSAAEMPFQSASTS